MGWKSSRYVFVTLSIFFSCIFLLLAEARVETVFDHRLLLTLVIPHWRRLVDLLEGGPTIIRYEDGGLMVDHLLFDAFDLTPAVTMLVLMFLWLLKARIAWEEGRLVQLAFFQLLDELLMFCYLGCNIILSDIIASHIHCTNISHFTIETLSLWGEDCTGMVLGDSFQDLYLFFPFGLFFLEVALHHKGYLFHFRLFLLIFILEPGLLWPKGRLKFLLGEGTAHHRAFDWISTWPRGEVFSQIGMPFLRKISALSRLCLLQLVSHLIKAWTHNLLILLREALDGGAEELKAREYSGSCCGRIGLIWAGSGLLVLVVDHFPEFGLEGVIGLVDLGF
jgi:hypothetical protein